MKWLIAQARQHFSELLKSANDEPQIIYHRDRPVAAVIDIDTLKQFNDWKEQQKTTSLADAFDELREICGAEDYVLEIPSRQNRDNAFAETLNDLPR